MQRRSHIVSGLLVCSAFLGLFGLANGAEPTTLVLCAPDDAAILPVDAPVIDAVLCDLPGEVRDDADDDLAEAALSGSSRKGFKVDLEDHTREDSKDQAQFLIAVLERHLTASPGDDWFLEVQPMDWEPEVCWVGALDAEALAEDPCIDLTLFDENGILTEQEPL